MSTPAVAPSQTLAQSIRAKYPGQYDDMDDYSLEQKVLAKYPQYGDMPRTQQQKPPNPNMAQFSAQPAMWSLPWLKSKLYTMAHDTADALPGILATGGAMAGGTGGTFLEPGGGSAVGAVGGAGLGGMAGEAARQLMRRALGFEAPATSTEAVNNITKEGAFQGATEAASAGLSRFAPWLKNSAVKQYQQALSPTTRINKNIAQEITPQLIQRGEYGSLEGMERRAGQKVQELSPQLDQEYQALKQASPTIENSGNQVIADLENAKQQFMAGGKIADPAGVQAIEGVQDIVKQYGPSVSPTTLRELRQVFESPVAQAGGYAGTDLSTKYALNAKNTAANSIRRILNTSPSDIGALNKEISFWLDVQRVTGSSALRRTGQEGGLLRALGPLGSAIAGGGGYAAGGAQTGAEAAAITYLGKLGVQITRSPAWRTASAVAKDRLAQALASGDVGQVAALATRFGAGAASSRATLQGDLQRVPSLQFQSPAAPQR